MKSKLPEKQDPKSKPILLTLRVKCVSIGNASHELFTVWKETDTKAVLSNSSFRADGPNLPQLEITMRFPQGQRVLFEFGKEYLIDLH